VIGTFFLVFGVFFLTTRSAGPRICTPQKLFFFPPAAKGANNGCWVVSWCYFVCFFEVLPPLFVRFILQPPQCECDGRVSLVRLFFVPFPPTGLFPFLHVHLFGCRQCCATPFFFKPPAWSRFCPGPPDPTRNVFSQRGLPRGVFFFFPSSCGVFPGGNVESLISFHVTPFFLFRPR